MDMHRARVGAALFGLLILSIILMVSGTMGSFGRVLCVIFAPGRLAIRDQTQRSGVLHTIVQSVTPGANATASSGGTVVTQ